MSQWRKSCLEVICLAPPHGGSSRLTLIQNSYVAYDATGQLKGVGSDRRCIRYTEKMRKAKGETSVLLCT